MKRILVFAAYYYPHLGGSEKCIHDLARRLVERGHEVDLVTCNTERAPIYELLDGVHVYRLPCRSILASTFPVPVPCLSGFRILRGLLRKKHDVINTQTRFFPTSLLGLAFSVLTRTPLLHTERGSCHSVTGNKVVALVSLVYDHTIGSLIAKSAQCNIGVSQAACDFLNHLGARRVRKVYDGIDSPRFRPVDTGWRDRLGISRDSVVITYVGRLIYAKGVQDLIGVFSEMPCGLPHVVLLIVGGGPHRAELQDLAYKGGCSQRIVFLGEKEQNEVIDVLAGTDIFVNPSYSEGLPTAVLEAASMGVPIIATDVGGTSEIIPCPDTGILFSAGDRTQLRHNLLDLVSDREKRARLGARAKARVETTFDWDVSTQHWLDTVRDVVRRKGTRELA